MTGSRLLNLCMICTVFDSSNASDCFTLRAFPIIIGTGSGTNDGCRKWSLDEARSGKATDCFPLVPRGRNDGSFFWRCVWREGGGSSVFGNGRITARLLLSTRTKSTAYRHCESERRSNLLIYR